MIGRTRWVNCRLLRYGYTTGSCAAAAAKAAAFMLQNQTFIKTVTILTPLGIPLELDVLHPKMTRNQVQCAVQKDAGDDPDVTDGVQVVAAVRFQVPETVTIEAGEGIGLVTREGIGIPVGQSAISKTPCKMIQQELLPFIKPARGIHLLLSIPGGADIAPRTMNPRLGIEGGISIIGTTGIVEPMSQDGFIKALFIEIDMLLQDNPYEITLVFGNYGKQFFSDHCGPGNKKPVLKIGNVLGEVLDYLKTKEVRLIRLVGHIGKMIKVAGGIFNTMNRIADGRLEICAALAAASGAPAHTVRSILKAVTTEAALALIPLQVKDSFVSLCLKRVASYLRHRLGNRHRLQLIMFSLESGRLGQLTEPGANP